jgi:hypothetical protein
MTNSSPAALISELMDLVFDQYLVNFDETGVLGRFTSHAAGCMSNGRAVDTDQAAAAAVAARALIGVFGPHQDRLATRVAEIADTLA